MIPPDEKHLEKIRRDRIWFVKKNAEWVCSVPNEVWSKKQSDFINSQYQNRNSYPLTKIQYLHLIETARSLSDRRKGSPSMPDRLKNRMNGD